MNFKFDDLANCERGEIVKAVRHNIQTGDSTDCWAMVCDYAENESSERALMWMEAVENQAAELALNYPDSVMRTGKKARIGAPLENVSLREHKSDPTELRVPELMVLGERMGFLVAVSDVKDPASEKTNAFVSLDGKADNDHKVSPDGPLTAATRLNAVVESWSFDLADESSFEAVDPKE